MVKMPSDGRRCEAEHVAQFRGTDGSMFQNGTQHAVPGALVCIRHRQGGDVAALSGGAWRPVPGKRHSSSIAHGIHNTIMS
jgi:hypothetical protein